MVERVVTTLGGHIWAEGDTSWPDAVGAALAERDQSLAVVELGTGGSLASLLGDRAWLTFAESLAATTATAKAHGSAAGLEHLARRGAELGEASIGIAVRARARGADTAVAVVVTGPGWIHRERRMVFLGGSNGRTRAALAAVHVLLAAIRAHGPG
jgi:nicotinamide mononucleotide (NMN) deamidase PncC